MTQETVFYQRNFQIGQFLFETIGRQIIIEPGETETEAWERARKAVLKNHEENNPHLFDGQQWSDTTMAETEKPTRTILDDIKDCTFIEGANGLKGYAMIAKTNAEWLKIYNEKLEELSK